MELNNLNCNILPLLRNDYHHPTETGAVAAGLFYGEFSEIPDEAIATAINSLEADGLIKIDRVGEGLTLTDTGRAKIDAGQPCSAKMVPSASAAASAASQNLVHHGRR